MKQKTYQEKNHERTKVQQGSNIFELVADQQVLVTAHRNQTQKSICLLAYKVPLLRSKQANNEAKVE